MPFDYGDLRGLITKQLGSAHKLAVALGVSDSCLSEKLNGNVQFSQSQINSICDVLSIDGAEIGKYFFTEKV